MVILLIKWVTKIFCILMLSHLPQLPRERKVHILHFEVPLHFCYFLRKYNFRT